MIKRIIKQSKEEKELNNLQIIDQRELLGKDFKVYGTFESPLFLAKDVADWIEHSNSTEMLRGIDDTEKLNSTILSSGQNREVTMITEDGLYEVLMQSRKPIAKEFKKKIKGILKDIRKHGMYAKDELLDNPDLLLDVISKYKKEREERKLLQDQMEKDRPRVIFAEALEISDNSILVGDLAKILRQNNIQIGQNRMFEDLRKDGYLISRKSESYNMPTQKSMDMGLFEIKVRTINNPDGSVRTTKTPKVTAKGQIYFVNRYKKEAV
jgi:anti-repressor protein